MEDWIDSRFIRNLRSPAGVTYQTLIKRMAQDLVDCIENQIQNFYNDYAPKKYKRTGYLLNHHPFRVSNNISVVGTTISIKIELDPAYHASKYGGGMVDIVRLMNWGYKVKKPVKFRNVEYFGYRKGFYFIEKGIADFRQKYAGYDVVTDMSSINPSRYRLSL